jgi:flagellar biogenesis protein FliO
MRIVPQACALACLLLAAAPALTGAKVLAQRSVYAPPGSADSQHPVRTAIVHEPVLPAAAPAPLKLAPRSGASGQKLERPIAPTAEGAIGTVVGSLGIVLGLFLVLVWCSRKFAPAGAAQLPKEAVELLGRATLGPRQQMQLVRVGSKLLLVALTQAGEAQTLTEITDPHEVEHLAGLCRRGQSTSATSSFNQVLGQLAREPLTAGAASAQRSRTRGAT